MARLTRAQQQARTRERVLEAARGEFRDPGYRHTTVDKIAERAELTRGAVYSNYRNKLSLLLAVTAEDIETATVAPISPLPLADAVAVVCRTMLDPPAIDVELLAALVYHEQLRPLCGPLLRLSEALCAAAIRAHAPATITRSDDQWLWTGATVTDTVYRLAQMMWLPVPDHTIAHLIAVCQQMVAHGPADDVKPLARRRRRPRSAPVPVALDELPWAPPAMHDQLHARPAHMDTDGVVAIVGTRGLHQLLDLLHAPVQQPITLVIAVTEPAAADIAALARIVVADLSRGLRAAGLADALPVNVVIDTDGAVAAAGGIDPIDPDTEAALFIRGANIRARAAGAGALAVVSATAAAA